MWAEMKNTIFHQYFAVLLGTICLLQPVASAAPCQNKSDAAQETGLEFNFNKADWPTVIEWYADQAGLILESVDQFPEGTFSLVSDGPMSPVDAIDEINHKLRLSEPPKTLLRNGVRLYLVDAESDLPAELVETIDVRELDKRGKYEPLQVVFDVSGLNLEDIENQIDQRVQDYNKGFLQTYPVSKQIFVRESGENLRFIRDVIERAKKNLMKYSSYRLKHISAEMFLDQISPFFELDESYRNPDGTLIVSIDSAPGSQRLILRSTPDLLEEFKLAAAEVDVEVGAGDTVEAEKKYIQQYPVARDSEETFNIIDRLLFDEGRGARVIQGSETGKITVQGTKKDHELVLEVLNMQANSGGFAIVQLKNGDAGDILLAVQNLMGITVENAADGPTMIANTDRDFIMVRGTPQQVTEVKQYIGQLDEYSAPVTDGLRTVRRVIPMSEGDRDRILDSIEDFWPTMGRDNPFSIGNPFDIRKPKETEDSESLLRKNKSSQQNSRLPVRRGVSGRRIQFQSSMNRIGDEAAGVVAAAFPVASTLISAAVIQSPDDPSPGDFQKDGYQPPRQIKSVPGAPVRVWGTPYGIIIESKDFDAGDDVEYLIDQQLTEESEIARPTIYQLKHVEASYMKSLLEIIYGLESSDGGGGGSGLLGGIADNVMGEAGSGMMDSLFGGGLGGGSGTSALEGDVTLGVDGRLNYMIVMGATNSDLDMIDSTVDLFDIPTSPQEPEIGGQIYKIQIQHRDPEEVKALVDSILEMYFKDGEEGGGGGGGGRNDAANMMKMMQALSGRGGGGGGASTQDVKARGYLGVDLKTSQLIFMGPKSIFRQVEAIVAAIDLPEVEVPRVMVQLDLGELEPTDALRKLKEILGGDKIDDSASDEKEGSEGGAVGGQGGNRNAAESSDQQKAQEAARNNFIQMMQQRARQQGGGARGQGGGGRGGQGGGGRGGRGGGR